MFKINCGFEVPDDISEEYLAYLVMDQVPDDQEEQDEEPEALDEDPEAVPETVAQVHNEDTDSVLTEELKNEDLNEMEADSDDSDRRNT